MKPCNKDAYGVYLWTGGKIDYPGKRGSSFHWTRHSGHPLSMSYTNWSKHQPDYWKGVEGCVNIWPQHDYTWNDQMCKKEGCFVCE